MGHQRPQLSSQQNVHLALMGRAAPKTAAAIAMDITINVITKLDSVIQDVLLVTKVQHVTLNVDLALMGRTALKTAAAIAMDIITNVTTRLEFVAQDVLLATKVQNVTLVSIAHLNI
ncbi:hypothetical protein ElyMa_006207200 [Elysia marginata]|uniref:Uncharacterized protein n=1 Tax=Elysia marginata TaxID=1093978 RepID=A0AAV4H5E5_9GAST|nr:hypothetical protein ElyMa_006207200 [Elysia marginata]